jgi:hypothetical protein
MRLISALIVVAATAHAGSGEVYVNGINVDGLTGQTFEKVNVKIDEKGNVYIDAPGYSVKRLANERLEPQPEAVMTRKYFLVTEQNVQGATEYDVDVFLNGKFLRSLSSTEPQLVSEVTKYLKPGRNTVVLQARKKLENKDQPKSTSKANLFRVIIGEGQVTQEQVVIEKQVVTFTRTAAESGDVTQEFSFTTR